MQRLTLWRTRAHRRAIHELHTRHELQSRQRYTARVAVSPGLLYESVDLGIGQVIMDKIANVVGDHGRPAVRARLQVVICIAGEGPETLPAEVVAAALAFEDISTRGRRE